MSLNESPSEKEGKFVPKKMQADASTLNESPSEKEGKLKRMTMGLDHRTSLNESPSEKEGKSRPEAVLI